jgi:hypothetical protein
MEPLCTPSTSDNHRLNVASVLAKKFEPASWKMETAELNSKSDPVQDISPDGDVILVAGPRKAQLRIQSQCLRCASRVFGAMFKPDWIEGQGLSKESPQEVLLEEDDADALRTICFLTGISTPPNPLAHVTLRRLCSSCSGK